MVRQVVNDSGFFYFEYVGQPNGLYAMTIHSKSGRAHLET